MRTSKFAGVSSDIVFSKAAVQSFSLTFFTVLLVAIGLNDSSVLRTHRDFKGVRSSLRGPALAKSLGLIATADSLDNFRYDTDSIVQTESSNNRVLPSTDQNPVSPVATRETEAELCFLSNVSIFTRSLALDSAQMNTTSNRQQVFVRWTPVRTRPSESDLMEDINQQLQKLGEQLGEDVQKSNDDVMEKDPNQPPLPADLEPQKERNYPQRNREQAERKLGKRRLEMEKESRIAAFRAKLDSLRRRNRARAGSHRHKRKVRKINLAQYKALLASRVGISRLIVSSNSPYSPARRSLKHVGRNLGLGGGNAEGTGFSRRSAREALAVCSFSRSGWPVLYQGVARGRDGYFAYKIYRRW